MNASEIEALTTWDEIGLGRLALHVPLFGREVPIVLFPNIDAEPAITQKMVATLADVLAIGPESLQTVKDMLWDEANFAFTMGDYGVEAEAGETNLQAHLRDFGIAGPEIAYARSEVEGIHVIAEHESRFAEIKVMTGAHNLVSVVVKDGRIVDWDNDGTYLPQFEGDEQAAMKRRAELVA